MTLNKFGEIVKTEWIRTLEYYNNIELDKYIIMPNHLHGIINITDKSGSSAVGAIHELPLQQKNKHYRRKMLIPMFIGRFKMNSSKKTNIICNSKGISLWQRNYYEHVIRTEKELNSLRDYIKNNPLKWALDKENPEIFPK